VTQCRQLSVLMASSLSLCPCGVRLPLPLALCHLWPSAGPLTLVATPCYGQVTSDDAVRRLLDRVYKELALLGLISFTLFMIQTFATELNAEMYEVRVQYS
jgi:hypothetical protein